MRFAFVGSLGRAPLAGWMAALILITLPSVTFGQTNVAQTEAGQAQQPVAAQQPASADAAVAPAADIEAVHAQTAVPEPVVAAQANPTDAERLAKLQADVDAIRKGMTDLLAVERRKSLHAAWEQGMRAKRASYPVGRVTALVVAGTALTTGLTVLAIHERGPAVISMTALSGVLTTAAVIKLARLVRQRRLITREIRERALPQ
jgi:hypothetical protein